MNGTYGIAPFVYMGSSVAKNGMRNIDVKKFTNAKSRNSLKDLRLR